MSQSISIFTQYKEARSWCNANRIGTAELRRAGLPRGIAKKVLSGRLTGKWEVEVAAFMIIVGKLQKKSLALG